MRSAIATIAIGAAAIAATPAPAAPIAQGRGDPLVITGAAVEKLNGVAPAQIVGFRFRRTKSHRHERWTQIPIQVDEREFVDFGSAPDANDEAGVEGTVYGTEPIGVGALQYSDSGTFVGPDADPKLDGDDEIALIAADAGDRARKRTRKPPGVWNGGATRVEVTDPLGGATRFVYLYRSKGALDAAAGRDYVDYEFALASGGYRATYRRADGPNPEASRIATASYTVSFSDRWFYDGLAIRAGGAPGVDILDGFKFSFGPTSCGRSEATFNDGEGAFVANLDGPVRAIRSYVGANSGPLTERTHVFYPDRHLVVTDLRVHAVPGPLTYHDLSAAGVGMSYLNSANPAGVTVDGSPEALDPAAPAWHLWTGAQGSLLSVDRLESSFAGPLLAAASGWYLDDATPEPNLQCWGDEQALGQGGLRSTYSMPNTDPRSGPADYLHSTTTDLVSGPGLTASGAEALARAIDAPLQASTKPLAP